MCSVHLNDSTVVSAALAERVHGIPRARTDVWHHRELVRAVEFIGRTPLFLLADLCRLNQRAELDTRSTRAGTTPVRFHGKR